MRRPPAPLRPHWFCGPSLSPAWPPGLWGAWWVQEWVERLLPTFAWRSTQRGLVAPQGWGGAGGETAQGMGFPSGH